MWIAVIVEYFVLALLVGLSIFSIAIMFDRRRAFAEAYAKETYAKLRELVRSRHWDEAKQLAEKQSDLCSGTLMETQNHDSADATEHAVQAWLGEKKTELEKGLGVLATLGANAPFIGLFGTVVGIIRAFAALSADQAGSASVMSGISVALIATAAGLAVAIPAVIAFNTFQRKLDVALNQCQSLKNLILAYRFEKG